MTHPEQIMKAVATLVIKQGLRTFSRQEVRDCIGVGADEWLNGYTAIFQAMRDDHPGGAPNINNKFKDVFHRVSHGVYELTPYGQKLLKEFSA